ncbi:MAG: glycogen/starch/alpha-glucan phosphorylase [Lachnospiraceae bacterium]|nr:glycogen/starch/alpha-glucan phosphorylase [Lachnospiraceae bacterium]
MENKFVDREQLKKEIEEQVKYRFRKKIEDAGQLEIFQGVCYALKDQIIDQWIDTHKRYEEKDAKIVYYLSMEFLMGRALGNNLINLGEYEAVSEIIDELGLGDIYHLEDQEPDAALGNGGLGRLAACFLDSLATLGYPAYGCGIRYQYGMFRQRIVNGYQQELPDDWLANGNPFEIERREYTAEIRFGGQVITEFDENGKMYFRHVNYDSIQAVPFDVPVVGYKNGIVNTLRIWDARPMESFDLESFDRGNYAKARENKNTAKTIIEVLYPNDNYYSGKQLRLKQQYFFVSASIQTAIRKYRKTNDSIYGLADKVCFQLNDTHPTVAVAELMRILLDEYGLEWDQAWDITTHCCAYTNHTIMAEALEKWPIDLFSGLLPRIYQIIEEIHRRFCEEISRIFPGDQEKIAKMAILYDGQVHMARLAIAGSFSVNGVAALHTEILKNQELKEFYEMMPGKFNNKTNGITQRRFLVHGNPGLAKWITAQIGDGYITDLEQLKKLEALAEDRRIIKEFGLIKRANKMRLAEYVLEHNGIKLDTNSLFDCQVKRLHEYKRQLLNILHVISLYLDWKENPKHTHCARTVLFGAKSAPGYERAKLIIKLIGNVADVINQDPDIKDQLKVVFIEDYRVSNAELIFAAADLSEQISTASKEASGTGNMKFMLNGALTIGTMDGANVEIVEEVGAENAFVFGLSSDEVIAHEKNRDYDAAGIYAHNPKLKRVMDCLIDGTFTKEGEDKNLFRSLYDSLLNGQNGDMADRYFVLADFDDYIRAQQEAEKLFAKPEEWNRKAFLNVCHAGKFSSDRTIEEYVRDIWHLQSFNTKEA